jgi:hypothetical protein
VGGWSLSLKMAMLSHRNSYSAGSASAAAAYGFRPSQATGQTRTANTPVREGHSAEYEVQPPKYLIQAPWPIYALDWVKWPHANLTHGATIALGSFLEEASNKVPSLPTTYKVTSPLVKSSRRSNWRTRSKLTL